MKSYLITGGAGFIGSSLARRLLSKESGCEITIIDNLSTGFISNIPAGCHFVKGDVFDDLIIESLNNTRFDAIYHIAGQSSADISFDNPLYDFKTNGESTLKLLNYCTNSGTKRIIFASTMSVYGDVQSPVTEEQRLIPNSFYGVGKIASEHYLRIFQTQGVNTTSLRLFNVYGPGQNMQNLRQGMVSIFMHHILKGEDFVVKGSPKRFRDFIYIDDVIDAFISCEKNETTYGKEFNIGTGIKTTIDELLSEILIISNTNADSIKIDFMGTTNGDQHGIYANCQKAKTDLNWTPRFKLKDGLKLMVDYYRNFEEYKC